MDRDKARIEHIIEAIGKIEVYIKGLDYQQFIEDGLLADAVVFNLLVIGEAAKNISSQYKDTHTEIPWKDVMGMRDKLIHNYNEIDLNVVWDTATKDIKVLRALQ